MAQNEPLKENIRGAVDPYEIRRQNIQPQLEVFARPTDPFVNPGDQGKQLVNALSAIHPALMAYGQMQESQKADNQAQGKADAANDQLNGLDMSKMSMDNTEGDTQANKPSGFFNLGVGYNEAYDQMNGQLHANDVLKPKAWQFYQDNQSLPPDEFAKKFQQEVLPDFIGTMTPHQMAGFLPEATRIEDQITGANREQFMKDQQTQKLATISASNRIDLEAALQKVLGVTSIEQMLPGDPSGAYKKFLQAKDSELAPGAVSQSEQLADTVYSFYRQALSQAKAVGLTTQQASANFLGTVSEMSKRYGMPELLQYAYKTYKPTDEEAANGAQPDNISVADAFPEKLQADILKATEAQHKMQAAMDAQDAAEAKATHDTFLMSTRDKMADLMNSNDPQRLSKMVMLQTQFRAGRDAAGITPTENDEINTMVSALTKQGSFAGHDDSSTITKLYTLGSKLTPGVVNANMRNLTEGRYTALMQRAWDYEKAAKDRSDNNAKYLEHKGMDLMISGIDNQYVVRDKLTGILDPDAEQLRNRVMQNVGLFLQGNPQAKAADLLSYYKSNILPVMPIPKNPMSSDTGASSAPRIAPKGTLAMVDGKTLTSDGHGGWQSQAPDANAGGTTRSGVPYTVESIPSHSLPAGAVTGNYKGQKAYRIGSTVYDMTGKRLN